MKINVKLMATLRSKLPPESKGVTQMEFDAGSTVLTVLQRLGIDTGTVHAVMVNDEMELERGRTLADGDSLVLIPPVGGG
jgi:molybdopterin converting factor small subunit